jgi:uncharacterized iron-regulated protein
VRSLRVSPLPFLPALLLLASGCGLPAGLALPPPSAACVTAGQWVIPTAAGPVAQPADRLLADFARRQVVLLGETHEEAEHHRWQLHTIAALFALQPRMALGFEMFPRRVQPVLDDWVAGRLGEGEFLTRVDWWQVWGFDPQLYLPIFQFARMHRLPMLALNVERNLVAQVREQGWAGIPPAQREGVTDPAPATRAYAEWLHPAYAEHRPPGECGVPPCARPAEADLSAPAFRRFVEAMQLWDRAMAQGIAERLRQTDPSLVVAILGSGHLKHGYGVPRQLRDLGVTRIAVALPWDAAEGCGELSADLADALFGIESQPRPGQSERLRPGIAAERAPRAAG